MRLPLLAALPTLPLTDPVLIVAVATVVFLVVPLVSERLRVPGVIGLIVAGAAVGPYGIGLLARDATIVLLGTVGLLYLMLMVGLELDLNEFNRYRSRSLVFGLLSFLVPAVAGTAWGMALGYPLSSSLLVASAFSSHTLLAFPIASRLGIVKNEAVTTALGGTILTEILALLLLAVVANSASQPLDVAFWVRLILPFAVYVGVVLWGLPRIGRWFFRRRGGEGGTEFIFVLAALFTVSYLAHAAGVEPIVGALLAGLALNRLVPAQGPLMSRIHFAGNSIFIPFFLLSVGMLVNVRALDSGRAWLIALTLAGGVVASKWLGAWITQRVFRWTPEEGWVVFGLSVPHAAGTLAIVLVGYEIGLLDQTEVNGVVVMILATCLVGPAAVERFGRRVALREEQRPYDPGSAPRRILVPLANPATAEALMDLAFVVRAGEGDEPLLPLTVAPEEGQATEAWVAEAERMLARAVQHAAAAGVPVVPVTRVDANVAAGVARGISETRSTTVVIGWDGRPSGSFSMYGRVLDQLLEKTRQLVLVAKLGHPLNVTRRLVVVFPAGIDRHPGFAEGMRAINRVASGVGASVTGLTVRGDAERVHTSYATVRPQMAAAWEAADGWTAALDWLREGLRREDVVVLVSTRRGAAAWQPRLERLPEQLAGLTPESFLAVYLPEDEAPVERAQADGALPSLSPERVVAVDGWEYRDALERMLSPLFDSATARNLADTLAAGEARISSEIAAGVVLPHARLAGIPRPLLVLGVSRVGISLPLARRPAHLVFLLVSPADRPEEHLRTLAAIARTLSSPAEVSRLIERHAPDGSVDWMRVDE